jgi:hypothetical protein
LRVVRNASGWTTVALIAVFVASGAAILFWPIPNGGFLLTDNMIVGLDGNGNCCVEPPLLVAVKFLCGFSFLAAPVAWGLFVIAGIANRVLGAENSGRDAALKQGRERHGTS